MPSTRWPMIPTAGVACTALISPPLASSNPARTNSGGANLVNSPRPIVCVVFSGGHAHGVCPDPPAPLPRSRAGRRPGVCSHGCVNSDRHGPCRHKYVVTDYFVGHGHGKSLTPLASWFVSRTPERFSGIVVADRSARAATAVCSTSRGHMIGTGTSRWRRRATECGTEDTFVKSNPHARAISPPNGAGQRIGR